jgi:hypothetical protein
MIVVKLVNIKLPHAITYVHDVLSVYGTPHL